MEASIHGITAPSAVYEIGGRRFEIGSRGFAEAIADAHAAHQRPRCMCLVDGAEMYVARLGDGYIVKRMPDTGRRHAPDCPSYEPPAEFSGLGQVLGSAITEDPATGETTLKLDFALARLPGRSTMPPAGGESDSVSSAGTRLSLRGLLHYLWDQAELTRWHPGFAGKRSWQPCAGSLCKQPCTNRPAVTASARAYMSRSLSPSTSATRSTRGAWRSGSLPWPSPAGRST